MSIIQNGSCTSVSASLFLACLHFALQALLLLCFFNSLNCSFFTDYQERCGAIAIPTKKLRLHGISRTKRRKATSSLDGRPTALKQREGRSGTDERQIVRLHLQKMEFCLPFPLPPKTQHRRERIHPSIHPSPVAIFCTSPVSPVGVVAPCLP
jgi:hypothetical protein